MNLKLRDYQKEIFDKQAEDKSFIIAKMGAGKTSATLMRISVDLVAGKYKKVLIVAPLAVANNVWGTEIEKWDNFKHLSCAICTGTVKNRLKQLNKKVDILIINNDNLKWLVNTLKKDVNKFGFLVVDESSCFKNGKSARTKALAVLTKFIPKITLLTGTPVPNSYLDIWSQVFMLDHGSRLEKHITKYRDLYFTQDYFGYTYTIKKGADKIIQNKIKDLCLVVKNYDNLPKVNYITQSVKMCSKSLKLYAELKKEMILEIADQDITAVNSAVLVNKLQQLSNGAIYNENKDYINVHDKKLEMLEQIIDSCDSNVLVAYMFKHDKYRISERIKGSIDIKEPDAIEKWNNKKIKVLLAHPKSAGHGLNLQEGGNVIIWFCPTYSSELKRQFDARILRQGQEKEVTIYTLICENTVDEKVYNIEESKNNVQNILISYLKI